jgi:hypothetical protein
MRSSAEQQAFIIGQSQQIFVSFLCSLGFWLTSGCKLKIIPTATLVSLFYSLLQPRALGARGAMLRDKRGADK